jgi:hypothetical protein
MKNIFLRVAFVLYLSCTFSSIVSANLFDEFIEKSTHISHALKDTQLRSISQTITNFAVLDGHYLESHDDSSINAYKQILEDEYYPLLESLQKLEHKAINPDEFFAVVMTSYIKNLRETVKQAEIAHEEDRQFNTSRKTDGLYKTGVALNFFRDPGIVPHCEDFLKIQASGLVEYWAPPGIRKLKDRRQAMAAKANFSRALQEEKDKMQALRDRTLPYRDEIEGFYNTLLHQSWRMMPDPTVLPRKTKKILNVFGYIWPVLKEGDIQGRGLDTLVKDYALSKTGELKEVFLLADSNEAISKPVKFAKGLYSPSVVSSTEPSPETTNVVETSTKGDTEVAFPLSKQEDIFENKTASVGISSEDSTNAEIPTEVEQERTIPHVRSLPTRHVSPKEEAEILHPYAKYFEEIADTKHIKYDQVVSLFNRIGGTLIRTNGSHETWEFKDAAGRVLTTFGFWKLHHKDHYGPWTKKLILNLENKLN